MITELERKINFGLLRTLIVIAKIYQNSLVKVRTTKTIRCVRPNNCVYPRFYRNQSVKPTTYRQILGFTGIRTLTVSYIYIHEYGRFVLKSTTCLRKRVAEIFLNQITEGKRAFHYAAGTPNSGAIKPVDISL